MKNLQVQPWSVTAKLIVLALTFLLPLLLSRTLPLAESVRDGCLRIAALIALAAYLYPFVWWMAVYHQPPRN